MNSRPLDLLRAIRGGRAVITALAGLLLLLIAGRALTGMYVEILWQSQTGYVGVFWRRVLWEWGVRAVGGLSVALLVYANLRIASTTLGGIQIRRRFGNIEISEQIPKRYVTWAMLTAAGLLGFWFGASIPGGVGRQFLLAMSAPAWGASEPVLGRDLGFYTFWFPVLGSVVTYALIVVFLVFTLATAGYAATGALAWNRGRLHTHGVARLHLGGILSAFFLFLAARLYLGRYELLLNGNSGVQQIFGFTDAMARLPALQTLTVISIAAAAATFWGAWKNRPWPIIASFGGVMLGSVLIGNLYPSLIQSFRVEPNELERERPYIQHSLDFTRRGFGLDDLERRTFDFDADAPVDWTDAAEQFAGLPVWGTGPLLRTYRESQAAYPYYDFDDITIDRYATASGPVPVALSVRQVDEQGIQDRNWQNLHLREIYLAGQGAVASIASTRSTEGRPEFVVRGIPPVVSPSSVGSVDVTLDRPQIYFGTQTQQEYGVVTPGPDQYLAPDGSTGVAGADFPEGIHLRSGIRTALLAWHFGAANLLFSSELTSESRLIHRREVVSRALAIAPFLRFPEAPYPVLHDGRVVWILEGFTGTTAFPLSRLQRIGTPQSRVSMVSYVRNSVKVTMDAVTGDTRFYRVPIEDPLADAYEAAYPDLVQPIDGMPQGLRDHLRYPKSLMQIQGDVLLQYHQETASAFHAQQDVWREPQELSDGPQPVPYRPEYGIYRLPGESEARFQLTTVFVPAGRDNLTAILVARADDDGTPETILIDVPVDDEVLGPRLVEAQIEQDPLISQQLTLWRSGGSTVWTGHMHLIPVGNRLLYMEAIFFAAEADAIPELRRFVVSDGVEIVMAESLADAIAQISDGAVAPPSRADADPDAAPSLGLDVGTWPASALELLDQAESRARAGDWQGYGEALDQLRALLERLRAGR